jgi:hypothetical protein
LGEIIFKKIKLKREGNMKSGLKKKKLALKKASIAHLNKENIMEIKDTLQRIKGGITVVSEAGKSCSIAYTDCH